MTVVAEVFSIYGSRLLITLLILILLFVVKQAVPSSIYSLVNAVALSNSHFCFVCFLPKYGQRFKYLCENFPELYKKRACLSDPITEIDVRIHFWIKKNEREAQVSFKVVTKYLATELYILYLYCSKKSGCLLSPKIHLLNSPLDIFPDNLTDERDLVSFSINIAKG